MRSSFVIVAVLVAALASQSCQAEIQADNPLDSVVRDGVVKVLQLVNKVLNSLETRGNNYLLEKLQNETQIKEWSVKIQTGVTTVVTEVLFDVFEAFKLYLQVSTPNPIEIKLLNCVSNQKSNIKAVVKNATISNGWCNNRLAANLTAAFQETTAALLSVNAEFKADTESLKDCSLGDTVCFTQFAAKVVSLLRSQVSGKDGTILGALKDVFGIYKIMFGQDVPSCAKDNFAPILFGGIRESVSEVVHCAFNL